MRQLAVQAASDTNTDSDRSDIQDEMDALVQQINQIAGDTEFNTKKLLDGSMGSAVTTAVANVQSNTALNSTTATTNDLVNLEDANGNNLGITAGDVVNVSYMKNGALVSNNTTVTGSTTLASLATSDFNLAASGGTVTATAATAGTASAIYGLTLTVTDSSGDQITGATNDLSNFTQTTAAQDVRQNGSSTIQIGANTNETMNINIDNMDAAALGVQGLEVDTQQSAGVAIKVIDTATSMVTSQLSQLGAIENRLSSVTNNLSTSSENLSSAESNVRDVDMASEMANYTKLSVLSQAATSMLAQANALPQQVLKLLQ
jgi:flagellin